MGSESNTTETTVTVHQDVLPKKEYHQAQRLGEGAFGAVCTVYDDDGQTYAMKVFECDEDDETLAKETLREVSVLRLLRVRAKEFGILQLVDVFTNAEDEICMVMPRLSCNLTQAIEGKLLKNKLKIAHSLLTAVCFLHENGVVHRDIKGDNIMFANDKLESVTLIDMSLAKPIGTAPITGITHTGDVGTAKYIAPEVYKNRPYGLKADMWSCGVVLLEVFSEKIMTAERDKAAFSMIEQLKAKLPPKKPITPVLTSLLETDPTARISAIDALKMEPFLSKFTHPQFEKVVDIIPCPGQLYEDDNDGQTTSKRSGKKNTGKASKKEKKKKNEKISVNPLVKKAYDELEFENQNTLLAADRYWNAVQNDEENLVTPHDCVLLASKLYELSVYDFDELEEEEIIEEFDKGSYIDSELAIFKAMDYNLYLTK